MIPLRVAALGDSLTEGLGDRAADGAWRGWAALLAGGLAPLAEAVELRNLAVSGARTPDVLHRQLPSAQHHRPQLASVVVGVNDTLRAAYDINAVARNLDATLGALADDGALLLTACLPDPGRMLGLPASLARPLARRMRSVNEVVHALSERYGAVHVHVVDCDWVHDPRMWSVDRLHPSERGHRALAREFHALLAARGVAAGPAPGAEPTGAAPGRAAGVWWMATRGTRWVLERCTDLLPDLLRLAAAEVRQRSSDRLDREAAALTAAVLAGLGPDRRGSGVGGPGPLKAVS
ncbi:SGNH/GDSL hydrolase family protein [Streptacidiphilus sp. N1-12]|uniref:SGNH/GDSL hydrolase family protein n=2 Tax=Streptacidiphilus alkalitolerans TaxID=3342712 RepID=A0ABV6VG69_9ACTN